MTENVWNNPTLQSYYVDYSILLKTGSAGGGSSYLLAIAIVQLRVNVNHSAFPFRSSYTSYSCASILLLNRLREIYTYYTAAAAAAVWS